MNEQAPSKEQVGPFVVGDGGGTGETRFRTYRQGMPAWTLDIDEAMQFARRRDAEAFCAEDEDAWQILPVPRLTHEPRADGCEVCAKPLPPVGAWSMPSCPDCQEVLGFLGELQADFAERDRTQKAEMVGNAIRLICSRTAPPPVPEHDPALCEANERLATIMTGAAGKHAERVVELEAEVSTLREHLAEQNRLLSLNCREVERLKAGIENVSWYEGEPDKQVIADMSRLKREGKL